MQTVTITEALVPDYQRLALALNFRRPLVDLVIDFREQLINTVLDYQHEGDHLSVALRMASFEIFQITEIEIRNNPTALNLVVQKIEKLRALLVNHLDCAPLQFPMLDGLWTWEKWIVDLYRTVSSKSPFTREPLQLRPHLFARNIIRYLEPLNPVLSPLAPPPGCLNPRVFTHVQDPEEFIIAFSNLALRAKDLIPAIEKDREVRLFLNNTAPVEQFQQEMRARFEQLERSWDRERDLILQRIEQNQADQRQDNERNLKRIQNLLELIRITKATADSNADWVRFLRGENQLLLKSLADLASQVQELRNQVNEDGGGSCSIS